MAVPKKKTARSRTAVRYSAFEKKTQQKLKDRVQLATCKNCGEKHLSHNVCTVCGFHGKREVIKKQKAAVTKVQA